MDNEKIQHKAGMVKYMSFIIWTLLLILPALIDFVISVNLNEMIIVLKASLWILLPFAFIYFINYYLIIPRTLLINKRKWFFICNIIPVLIVTFITLILLYQGSPLVKGNPNATTGLIMVVSISSISSFAITIGGAVAFRYSAYWSEMQMKKQEEEQKKSEAELAWLKNQLNPHFLFNTLNNISSLIQIDPDEAQESISQLSDLLRYALYDSNVPKMPLSDEINFMKNYIRLMQLRCPERTDIQVEMECPSENPKILPLLYITLIENAFKHGLSNNRDSFIHIRLGQENKKLIFTIKNSYFPKSANNHSGSGIGLENLRRRLELVYPKQYELITEQRDEIYFAQLILNI